MRNKIIIGVGVAALLALGGYRLYRSNQSNPIQSSLNITGGEEELSAAPVGADAPARDYQIQLNISGWTQEQINLIHATVALLLYQNNITHQGIQVTDGLVEVKAATGDVGKVITEAQVLRAYKVEKAKRDAAAKAESLQNP